MVEVDITDVKSDVTSVASVIHGIKCKINVRYVEITNNVYTEMME